MKKRINPIYIMAMGFMILITSFIISSYVNNEGKLGSQKIMTQTDKEEYTYQKIAWESLDKNIKQEILGSWQKSKVETIIRDNDFSIIPLNKSSSQINIQGKEMVAVSFNSKNEASLGKVIVYIDPQTKKAIGIAPRM